MAGGAGGAAGGSAVPHLQTSSLCWMSPFPKSNHSCSIPQQYCTSAAHPPASQESFNNSFPPGNQPYGPWWLASVVTFPPPSSPFFSIHFFFSVRNALCFSPHYSNLNTLPLSSPSTQTKPRGACSYSLFLLCFIFYLMTQNYPLRVSRFQPRIGRKGRELERTHG